jgi:hypothetical protein
MMVAPLHCAVPMPIAVITPIAMIPAHVAVVTAHVAVVGPHVAIIGPILMISVWPRLVLRNRVRADAACR